MGRVVVVGGGITGLSTAMMLARDGLEVVVLDQGGEAVPNSPAAAWSSWTRRGISQFHQAHLLSPRGYRILREHVPEALDVMLEAGASRFNFLSVQPSRIKDRAPRPGDDRFDTLAVRRPVLEYAMASCARRSVAIRRGVDVTGLIAETSTVDGIPRVAGVRTSAGEDIGADLVVDASGRRTRLPDWLGDLGARPPYEKTEDARTAYYTRFFHSRDGEIPEMPDGGLGHLFDSYSIVTVPGDRGYWSLTVVVSSADQELKELRHVDKWTDLIRACADHAHLLAGEADGGIRVIGGNTERLRRFVVDGRPVATGVLAVGDSVAMTNPTYGRGMSMGLIQAVGTAETVRDHLDDPVKLAMEHDAMLTERMIPCYRDTVQMSRGRADQIDASINGRPPQVPAHGTDPLYDLLVASGHDADFFRVFAENAMLLTPFEELLARPGLVERAAAAAKGREMPVPPGPSRPELLRMLAD
nr:FAD-dependent oxidoreductase [Kibdelosporangium sp. MJ126-NF4]CEL16516.1 putative secreted protein [Kibdelosporangium sp. MJ126-NF4]CTQ90469.1 putative secreted protein [Kibdelosporangium sp. MJ126-NF4]